MKGLTVVLMVEGELGSLVRKVFWIHRILWVDAAIISLYSGRERQRTHLLLLICYLPSTNTRHWSILIFIFFIPFGSIITRNQTPA
jgi:hypothetical protein